VIAENSAHETTEGAVTELSTLPAEAPTIEAGSFTAGAIGPRSAQLSAVVNPDYQETSYTFEYATDEALTENVGTASGPAIPAVGGAQGVSVLATGLIPGREYFFRITATNQTGTTQGPVATTPFTTLAVPHVNESTPEATAITQHTALIANITINPQMAEPPEPPIEPARYFILYGAEGEGYTQASPTPTHASAGFGFSGTPAASLELTGLTPGTTYHYELVASNQNGSETGPPHEFTTLPATPLTTPPQVGSETAGFVNETSAVIEAEVNPEGLPTTYQVQYGSSTAYGSTSPAGTVGPFATAQGTVTALTGFAAATTYHYRLQATNAAGTSYGQDATLTTTGTLASTFTGFSVPTVTPTVMAPFNFPPEETAGTPKKPLTVKQKLAKALKACHKIHKQAKRAACERQAHKHYKPAKHARKANA
jgi:hypothetical protein